MSSTTTTKKSNDGSCAACNKEEAVFRCAPCCDAGIDVFFCNRECQVKLWKTHKSVCKKTSNADSKKEQSSANKEAKAEGKKNLQHRKDTQFCDNCSKTDTDVGFKVRVCSRCKSAYYCSRECQVEDWPKHKRICEHNYEFTKRIERSLDAREMNISNLFEKWLEKRRTSLSDEYFSEAVYFAIKEKGIEQQPPVEAVILKVEFDYNAQTFILAEEPRAVKIADLSQESKEMLKSIWKESVEGNDQSYTHFLSISTKELGNRFASNMKIEITESHLDHMNAKEIDMFIIRNICPQVRLKSDLFRGWKSIRRNNLQKQMEHLGQSYTSFVENALQFFSNKSLQNTHRIMISMVMGKEIGQISHLLGYKVMTIAELKECKEKSKIFVIHVEDIIGPQPLPCTDIAIEIFFVDPEKCVAFEYTVFCKVNNMQNKTAKQCKKAADKHYRKLQQSVKEMPSDLLEKVSL
ncbi:hypothetical protein CTEN210_17767 [Chaetoceros tenuissimus]|uniref:MYND-type domain-containing protein n=1 Tax=Chaetoceros tenuissimus TaxID=426638 RepID=A0AAD3HFE2_9STRA|nr:hypothetical protein CTEN210_17767 [Chaetoceros tenuissimus]